MPSTNAFQAPAGDLYDRIVAALVDARKAARVPQTELAARVGRPQSFVSKYEHGERRLDVAEFVEIATAIGVDPVELLRRALSAKT